MPLFHFNGKRPDHLAGPGGQLAPCPAKPNAVSSAADDPTQLVAPLNLLVEINQVWPALIQLLTGWPRCQIISEAEHYLHAECSSAFFGFVDDLELLYQAEAGERGLIAMRSASRLGHSDLGVNRRRVERLRTSLAAQGLIAPH